MAYPDPFRRESPATHHTGYGEDQVHYDPYSQYPAYQQEDQSSYRDDTRPPASGPGSRSQSIAITSSTEKSRQSRASSLVPPKSTGDLRIWRSDEHASIWTKGGRGRCVGRFCCCSLLTTLFLLLSILFSIGLWIRPPDISFSGVQPQNGNAVVVQASGLTINLNFGIGVKNPNFFGVAFQEISATAYYPVGSKQIGGGSLDNVIFLANSDTTFNFPFQILYTDAVDPDRKILLDIADKCGFTGNQKRNVMVNYTLTFGIKILFVVIRPSFSSKADFPCPLKSSDIKPFLGSLQIPGVNA